MQCSGVRSLCEPALRDGEWEQGTYFDVYFAVAGVFDVLWENDSWRS